MSLIAQRRAYDGDTASAFLECVLPTRHRLSRGRAASQRLRVCRNGSPTRANRAQRLGASLLRRVEARRDTRRMLARLLRRFEPFAALEWTTLCSVARHARLLRFAAQRTLSPNRRKHHGSCYLVKGVVRRRDRSGIERRSPIRMRQRDTRCWSRATARRSKHWA